MSERKKIYDSISKIAFAYILILIEILIGTVDVLPDFVGYIMIVDTFNYLKDESRTIMLLKPFGVILAVWSFINFIRRLLGINTISFPVNTGYSAMIYILHIINIMVIVINIYFTYQLSTEMSLLAENYHNEKLSKSFIMRRNIFTVSQTVIFLINNIIPVLHNIPDDIRNYIMIAPVIISFAVMILIVSALFSLRKEFKDERQDQDKTDDGSAYFSDSKPEII